MNQILSSKIEDGNMSLKYDLDGSAILNRKKFFHKNKIPYENTLLMKVKYSDSIIGLADDFFKEHSDLSKVEIEADAIIIQRPNVFLYLPFGDCIPMAVFDSKNEVLAFAHMGWQSTELNFHIKIIEYMKRYYGTNISDIEIFLGPSIKKESYILKNPSQLKYKEWHSFLNHIGEDNYEIDLNGYICSGLDRLGIRNIKNSTVDTVKDSSYFSHYRVIYKNKEEQEGRFVCGAMFQ